VRSRVPNLDTTTSAAEQSAGDALRAKTIDYAFQEVRA
jgi:hypothetical protein